MIFFFGIPIAFNNSAQAIPAAPAPFITIVKLSIFLFVIFKALIRPAAAIMAVPC